VAKKTEIERLFAESKKAFGQLDILVNNAGIYEAAPLGQITEEHFHGLFNLNVLGLILTTQEASTTSDRRAEALSTSARLSAPRRPSDGGLQRD